MWSLFEEEVPASDARRILDECIIFEEYSVTVFEGSKTHVQPGVLRSRTKTAPVVGVGGSCSGDQLHVQSRPATAAVEIECTGSRYRPQIWMTPHFKEECSVKDVPGEVLRLGRNGRKKSFDLVLRHSSVSTILYHTTKKKLLLVKQFRPAVLIAHVLRQPENFGKKLSEVDWSKYDASHGYTLELCAGMIDKNIPIVDIAREEIEEECGYVVKNEDLQPVTTFNVAAHESGGVQYVFYTEINDSMKVTEGGGNTSEGEYIEKVLLSEDEVRALVASDYPISPSSMLYALLWWLESKRSGKPAPPSKIATYEWYPRDIAALTDLHFEQMPLSSRFKPLRLHFTIGSLSRTWDLALCDESFAVLLYNEDTEELIFTQRFRPAALIGLALHHSPLKTKLDAIDWASQPTEWAYTLEPCCGHHKKSASKQEIEEKVRESVALKCGYEVENLRFVTSYLIGISFSGDRQRAYFSKVNDSMKLKDWKPLEDILPCSIPRDGIQSYINTKMVSPNRPPSVLLLMQWFLNNQQKLTKGELCS